MGGTITAKWTGGRQFLASDDKGHVLVSDSEGQGFKPSEMLLVALVGCAGVDLVGILAKKRQQFSAIEVKATKFNDPEPPWAIQKIEVEWTVRGRGLKQKAVEDSVLLAEEKYCQVKVSLACEVVTTVVVINQDGE